MSENNNNNNNNEEVTANAAQVDPNEIEIVIYNMAAYPTPAYKIPLKFNVEKDTVGSIKQKVSEETLYKPEVFVLFSKGKPLVDDSVPLSQLGKGMLLLQRAKGTKDDDFPKTKIPQREISLPLSSTGNYSPNSASGSSSSRSYNFDWGSRARDDAKVYREGYPSKVDDPAINCNYEFYSNKRQSVPSGDFIDNIIKLWWGDYDKLEVHHGYVQWLFPIREHGLNSEAKPLQLHEAQKIKDDPKCIERAKSCWAMMLDFWGMKLDKQTGAVTRDDKFESRYRNLNFSGHNYLRITRILKFLGEIGLENFKKPFVEFMISEIYDHGYLKNTYESLKNYWIPVLRDDDERKKMEELLKEKGPVERDRFYFGNRNSEEESSTTADQKKMDQIQDKLEGEEDPKKD